jgi:hypothetical protein
VAYRLNMTPTGLLVLEAGFVLGYSVIEKQRTVRRIDKVAIFA